MLGSWGCCRFDHSRLDARKGRRTERSLHCPEREHRGGKNPERDRPSDLARFLRPEDCQSVDARIWA